MGEQIPIHRPEGLDTDAARKSLEDLKKKNAQRREGTTPELIPDEAPELDEGELPVGGDVNPAMDIPISGDSDPGRAA